MSKDKLKRERNIFDKTLRRRESMVLLDLARQLNNERIRTTMKSKQIEELQEKERCIDNLESQLQEVEESRSDGDLGGITMRTTGIKDEENHL